MSSGDWREIGEVPGDMAEILRSAGAAVEAVVNDSAVWAEETLRVDAEPLPWPLAPPGEGLPGFLRWIAASVVAANLERFGMADPQDQGDDAFQLILRVSKRAVDAVHDEVASEWDRPGRLDGWRDLMNFLKKRRMDLVARSGLKGKQAAAAAGLSTAGASRAQRRKLRGKG